MCYLQSIENKNKLFETIDLRNDYTSQKVKMFQHNRFCVAHFNSYKLFRWRERFQSNGQFAEFEGIEIPHLFNRTTTFKNQISIFCADNTMSGS
jgi:hypothetical protein